MGTTDVRPTKQSTYDISGPVCLMVLLVLVLALLTGCTNMTVVKLAEMCHADQRAPSSTFNGSTGKVDCR